MRQKKPDLKGVAVRFPKAFRIDGDVIIRNVLTFLTLKFTTKYVYFRNNNGSCSCYVFMETPDEITQMKEKGQFTQLWRVSNIANHYEFVLYKSTDDCNWIARKTADNSQVFGRLETETRQPVHVISYESIFKDVFEGPRANNATTTSFKATRKNKNSVDQNVISLGQKHKQSVCVCPNEKNTHSLKANYSTDESESKPVQETNVQQTTLLNSAQSSVQADVCLPSNIKCRYPSYNTQGSRIETYKTWPHIKPTSADCTMAGFFYKGPGDLVRCFCCGIGFKDFSEVDIPLHEHIKYSPKCAYLEHILGTEELNHRMHELKSTDPENIRQKQYEEFKTNRDNECKTKPYRHPEKSTSEMRMITFLNPNFRSVISPKELADAGLFYTGENDLVRCFACDGGFRNWDVNDDPWTEHCRWFPSCRFAREVKGDTFIENIQQQTTRSRHTDTNTEPASRHKNDITLDSDLEMLRVIVVDEMGFSGDTFKTALKRLKKIGTVPSIDDVIAYIESMHIQGTDADSDTFSQDFFHEDPITENQRLKSLLLCMRCKSNDANVLFLPCAHHRMCTDCARGIAKCPVCQQTIQTSVQTFLT
ncbi:baculoviral IAP repeat-containing protein 7-B-like isoform X2 [Dreissena polymorpha]|uniref:baculoviral IAP repeat-containing protein 7-B-like isoform X2 n=1 Tax=Dreissena polymorpha TaxID=45954 RepID=UPI0022651722|nr:baculoviral IAP repeat-containing protein 7-B-like isoform X2 [Dreissena polymorpha]